VTSRTPLWLPGVVGSFSPCEWRLFIVTDEERGPPANSSRS